MAHRTLLEPDQAANASEDMIANVEESADCNAHWIRASVKADGSYTVTNSRNGVSKAYTARRLPAR